jgi:hypothetical protein
VHNNRAAAVERIDGEASSTRSARRYHRRDSPPDKSNASFRMRREGWHFFRSCAITGIHSYFSVLASLTVMEKDELERGFSRCYPDKWFRSCTKYISPGRLIEK